MSKIVIDKKAGKYDGYLDLLLHGNQNEFSLILESALNNMIDDMNDLYKSPIAQRKLSIELTLQQSDTDSSLVGIKWSITPKPAPFDRTPKDDPARGQLSIDDVTGEVDE